MEAAAWIATLGTACWCAATMLRVVRRDGGRQRRRQLATVARLGGVHRPARKLQPVAR